MLFLHFTRCRSHKQSSGNADEARVFEFFYPSRTQVKIPRFVVSSTLRFPLRTLAGSSLNTHSSPRAGPSPHPDLTIVRFVCVLRTCSFKYIHTYTRAYICTHMLDRRRHQRWQHLRLANAFAIVEGRQLRPSVRISIRANSKSHLRTPVVLTLMHERRKRKIEREKEGYENEI